MSVQTFTESTDSLLPNPVELSEVGLFTTGFLSPCILLITSSLEFIANVFICDDKVGHEEKKNKEINNTYSTQLIPI